ncbi:MAG TPA: NTP transferase domain-containing protein [Candidatus Bathyarchaeia archaeon]|nr:NTP transferase domain-containing protein [Candidatus Bathyarchaeia archaeon]
MIGLVMCGGKGTRMESTEEKLLLKYKKPIIQHVITALQESGCFSKIVCATSPNAPKTRQFVKELGILDMETKGNGYVNDLNEILSKLVDDDQVFVTAGDLPLLDALIVKEIVQREKNKDPWLCVVVSKKFLDMLGLTSEYSLTYDNKECVYTGISIVDARKISDMKEVKESYVILEDKRIAINLNTKKDYDLLCAA